MPKVGEMLDGAMTNCKVVLRVPDNTYDAGGKDICGEVNSLGSNYNDRNFTVWEVCEDTLYLYLDE